MPLWVVDAVMCVGGERLFDSLTHRICVTGIFIYLHEWLMFMVHVGKYTTLTCILYTGSISRPPLKDDCWETILSFWDTEDHQVGMT